MCPADRCGLGCWPYSVLQNLCAGGILANLKYQELHRRGDRNADLADQLSLINHRLRVVCGIAFDVEGVRRLLPLKSAFRPNSRKQHSQRMRQRPAERV